MRRETDGENIIYFPNLNSKLAEKGMDALKNKRYRDALDFFEQLLDLEPMHPQAHLGKAISLIELGELAEAVKLCEKMLKEAIGNYYEVLQVYVSILMQLGEYDKVSKTLEAVIQEEKLPPNLAESFYQFLLFSRKMIGYEKDQQALSKEEQNILIEQLDSSDTEKQWSAVQQLCHYANETVINVLKQFLCDETKDPLLKSKLLLMLREQGLDETVYVHKFSQTIAVNPAKLNDIFASEFSENVKRTLSNVIESDNPTLYNLSLQIWWHYLFAVFPLEMTPKNESAWAAAVHFVSTDLQGMPINLKKLSHLYEVDADEVYLLAKKIEQMEKNHSVN